VRTRDGALVRGVDWSAEEVGRGAVQRPARLQDPRAFFRVTLAAG